MSLTRITLFAVAAGLAGLSAAQAEGDAARGQTQFTSRCSSCHALAAAEAKPMGPHLQDVFGRKAGSVEGARYSKALPASSIVWDEVTLDNFLAAPAKAVPGTSMMIGVPNAQDRADIVAYLKSATHSE